MRQKLLKEIKKPSCNISHLCVKTEKLRMVRKQKSSLYSASETRNAELNSKNIQ